MNNKKSKIVVLEKIEFAKEQKNKLNSLGDVLYYNSSDQKKYQDQVKNADVVVIDWINPNNFISSMKSPSLLALMSTGFSWIDIKKAKRRNILISNVPDYATEAVAEHVLGLIFAIARKIILGNQEIKKGRKEKGYIRGIELKGKRAGIIGLGNIGSRVAQILLGFGMKVVAYDTKIKKKREIKNVSLKNLLKNSDVIVITCSLNDKSKEMLGEKQLKLMKKNAILVGTTWGVVNLNALKSILKKKLIFGSGFDVSIEGDEINLPKDLIELENIVFTPHIGYNTAEAKKRQIDICIANVEAYLKGRKNNVVN